jgi:transposase
MIVCTLQNQTVRVTRMASSKQRKTKADKAGADRTQPLDRTFLDMTPEQVATLLERVDATMLPDEAAAIRGMAATVRCLDDEIRTKGTSIRRLRALAFGAATETTRKLFPPDKTKEPGAKRPKGEPKPGHGPRGSLAFPRALRVKVPHATLHTGDTCPECPKGRLYPKKRPAVMVRIVGMAPLHATVFEREVLRCSCCGESFPAAPPEGIGTQKYDETVPAMASLFRFGTGMPYHRFSRFLANLGLLLPTSTMNEMVMNAADLLEPVLDELMRWGAQGDLIHQDDTVMKILDRPDLRQIGKKLRKGVYTTGLISKFGKNRVALFITGMQHAGENLADLLKLRAADLAKPIQMCDALAANTCKKLDTIVAHCLAHARRKFAEVVDRFPDECRHLLETLREVYINDAAAEELSPPDRLAYHQEHSGKLMADLEQWLHGQIRDKLVEPNSGLGKAIGYMLNHWAGLTLFLREPGAPLDNNQIERGLKRAIMHRKNSMFYKTQEGARVGDLYMSLIHSAELNGANPFDYLVALLRNHAFVEENPEEWMPWNYQETLTEISK